MEGGRGPALTVGGPSDLGWGPRGIHPFHLSAPAGPSMRISECKPSLQIEFEIRLHIISKKG